MAVREKFGFRHPLFQLRVRNQLIREMMETEEGITRAEAREQAVTVSDEVIEEGAIMMGLRPPPSVRGPFLDWLANLDTAKIAALVKFLMSLFGFSSVNTPTPDLTPPPVA